MLAAMAAKSRQSCPTLYDPIDGSPPCSAIPGILQARTLEWVAISFSSEWKWKVKMKSFSWVWLIATPWTAAHQAPPSMGFSRQEYWSGLPLPSLKRNIQMLVTLFQGEELSPALRNRKIKCAKLEISSMCISFMWFEVKVSLPKLGPKEVDRQSLPLKHPSKNMLTSGYTGLPRWR